MPSFDTTYDPGTWGAGEDRVAGPFQPNSLGPVPLTMPSKYKPMTTDDPEQLAMSTGIQYLRRRSEFEANKELAAREMRDWANDMNRSYNDVMATPPPKPGPPLQSPLPDYMPNYIDVQPEPSQKETAKMPGLLTPGNIDLSKRPRVRNPDGTTSTVRSISFEDSDGKEVLIPTVSPEGRIMSDTEAIQRYNDTGEHLGKFRDPQSATNAALAIHEQQARLLGEPSGDNEGIARAPSRTSQTNRQDIYKGEVTARDFIQNQGEIAQPPAAPEKPVSEMTPVERGRADLKAIMEGRQGSEGGLGNLIDIILGKHNAELYGK